MQAIYAWYCTNEEPAITFDINLKDFADEIKEFERRKGDKGDSKLLMELFYDTISNRDAYDELIQSKAENWELDRIALIDRILMQMGISEMKHFEEIPIKVTINEYLEIAKKFSTPKSSKFINGILDSLYIQFKQSDQIQKSGRGLIDQTLPKRKPMGGGPGRPGGGPRMGGYGQGQGPGGGQGQGYGPKKPVPPRRDGDNRPPGDFRQQESGPRNPQPPRQAPYEGGGSTPPPGFGDDKKKRPRIRKNENDNENDNA